MTDVDPILLSVSSDIFLDTLLSLLNVPLTEDEANAAAEAATTESKRWMGSMDYHAATSAVVIAALKAVAGIRAGKT